MKPLSLRSLRQCRSALQSTPSCISRRTIAFLSATSHPPSAAISCRHTPPSFPHPTLLTPRFRHEILQRRDGVRAYSTGESSVQGTIGAGEKGIQDGDELARMKDVGSAPDHLNEKERHIWNLLRQEFKGDVDVKDISGGCGSMYGIEVVSERFKGLSVLKQQRLVNEVLGEEIKGWHGVQLRTRVP